MKKIFKNLFFCIISLIFFISCDSSQGNNKANINQEKKETLRVGMELQFPPFETIDKDGNPYGLSVELAQYLADKLEMNLEIINTSYSGLIPSLQSDKVDIVLSSMTITEDRLKVVDFSDPYAVSNLAMLININSPIESIEDANTSGVKVTVKKGTTGHIFAENNLKNAEIMVFDKESAAILEVAQGKADIFIYGQDTIYKAHIQNNDTTKFNLNPIGDTQYWGIAIKKGNTDLLNKINQSLLEFKKDGGFDKLSEKYLTELKQVFDDLNIPFFFDVDTKK